MDHTIPMTIMVILIASGGLAIVSIAAAVSLSAQN
jgi:hypothetical protein